MDAGTLVGTVIGVVSFVGGVAWKLGGIWTKQAIAAGERHKSEEETQRQLADLKLSHEKFMGRHEDLVKVVARLEVRVEERERARRDTLGIPVRSDGE